MRPAESVPMDRSASPQARSARLSVVRDILLVAAAGVVAAAISQFLGRPARLGLGMPLVGSLAVTLPRALVLLLIVARVKRPGALTGAAVCEVLSRAAMEVPVLGLTAFAAPIVGGVLADLAWNGARVWRSAGARLAVTGAVLSATRVLAAWALLVLLMSPARGTGSPAAVAAIGIVGFDALLGAAAGLLVAVWGGRKRPQE